MPLHAFLYDLFTGQRYEETNGYHEIVIDFEHENERKAVENLRDDDNYTFAVTASIFDRQWMERYNLVQFPLAITPLVLAYELPEAVIGAGQIVCLTRENVVGIMNGTIRFWNDTLLAFNGANYKSVGSMDAENCAHGNAFLANHSAAIEVVVGADGVTAQAFQEMLARFSPAFEASYGVRDVWSLSLFPHLTIMPTEKELLRKLTIDTNVITVLPMHLDREIRVPVYEAFIENREGVMVLPTIENIEKSVMYLEQQYNPATDGANATTLNSFMHTLIDEGGNESYPFLKTSYGVLRRDVRTFASNGFELGNNCSLLANFFRYVDVMHEVLKPAAAHQAEFFVSQAMFPNTIELVFKSIVCDRHKENAWQYYQNKLAAEVAARDAWYAIIMFSACAFFLSIYFGHLFVTAFIREFERGRCLGV